MNLDPDYLIERKRSKSQLAKWKIFALILLLGVFFLAANNGKNKVTTSSISSIGSSDYIARIKINDKISSDSEQIENIDKITKDKNIKAVIVNIDTGGGSAVGSEMLYNSILKLSKEVPVSAVMGGIAASGGYMAALGSDYIVAHNGTITGSIGVIINSFEITDLAKNLGVQFNNFKSGELKATPNFSEKLTPEAYQAMMDSVYDVHDFFIGLVAARRNLDIEYVRKIADGRIYSGKQALDLKLIDALGGEDVAIEWLQKEHNISEDLEIIDVKLKRPQSVLEEFFDNIGASISNNLFNKLQGLHVNM